RAEIELRRSLQRFHRLTALSTDWYWEQDEKLRFTQLAGRAVEAGAIDVPALIGRTRWETEALDSAPGVRETHDRAVTECKPFHDIVIRQRAGAPDPRVISVSGEPIFDEDGTFRGYRGIARDITLQKRAEHEIGEAKRFLDAMVTAIPAPLLVKDEQHRFVAINDSLCRFLGRTSAEILGKTDYDFYTPAEAAFFQLTDDQALRGEHIEYEREFFGAQGMRWMHVRKSALTGPDGSRLVVIVLMDVTARRQAEGESRASEQRFRSLTELSTDWFWEQDQDLRFTRITGAANHPIVGELQQHIGKALWEMPRQDADDERCAAQRKCMLAHQSFRDHELSFPLSTGELVHMSLNGEPVLDAQGHFVGYRGTATDVTERKLAQQRIARLKDMYAAMSEANSLIIHSAAPQELFESICKVAVDYVHFKFASIAVLEGRGGPIRTAATAAREPAAPHTAQ